MADTNTNAILSQVLEQLGAITKRLDTIESLHPSSNTTVTTTGPTSSTQPVTPNSARAKDLPTLQHWRLLRGLPQSKRYVSTWESEN